MTVNLTTRHRKHPNPLSRHVVGVIDPDTEGMLVDSPPDPDSIIAVCEGIRHTASFFCTLVNPHILNRPLGQYVEAVEMFVFTIAVVHIDPNYWIILHLSLYLNNRA